MTEPEITENQTEETAPEVEAEDGGAQVETDIQGVFLQIQKLEDERDQLRDQVLRAMADFKNFKTRVDNERSAMAKYASERLAKDLLPVLDNFERSVAHLNSGATLESIQTGISAVERQLRSTLENHGVKRIEAVGQPFDTEKHEALGFEETESVPEDTVSGEIEPGYLMHDRLLRPARVRVAKRPS